MHSGAIDERTSRDEPPSFQLLDALTQGTVGALLGASPDFVAAAGGGFSLLGGPAESTQLTIGGVRLPSGFVTGATRATITSSPWDVSNGGAAGATLNLELFRGRTYRSTYALVRSSASGVVAGGIGAPTGFNLPLQGSAASDGPLGRLRYSVNLFAMHDAVSLRSWDRALAPATRSILDSLASITGSPLVRTTEAQQQYGVITRLDLPRPESDGPARQSDAFTLALSRTGSDAGTRGGFNTGSAGFTTRLDVGAMQFESTRMAKNVARVISTLALSTARSSVDRLSDAPIVQLTDSGLGAVIRAGGSAPQPATRVIGAEARSQATWFSANNKRRYLLQLQARYEHMRVGDLEPYSTFTAASAADLQLGRAVSLTSALGAGVEDAESAVLAPAGSVGFDLGRRGSMVIGARGDGWVARGVLPGPAVRHFDVSPRLSFQQQVGRRSKGRGSFSTLRGGVGRFTDWPSLQQWSAAWSSTGGQSVVCSGLSVPSIDFTSPFAECTGSADVVSAGRLLASPSLKPVRSTRGELSLQIHQLVRGVRADAGIAAAQFERVTTFHSPYFGRAVAGRLTGEAGRALIVDPATIGTAGVVPIATLPTGVGASPVLTSDGRNSGYQYRLRLATRDPWARNQLEANYSWNSGRQRGAFIAPAYASPGLLSAPAAGNTHTIMASIGSWIGVSQLYATVIARSGVRFTPRADRDLNGDGLANDAAFIPSDRAADWAAASPASARSCIQRAAGSVIAPNACPGPWSVSSMLMALLPGPLIGLPRGMEVTLQITNPTALLGRLGGGRVTFGSSATVDPTLVRVIGFDATAQRFQTQRLQGFGRAVGLSRTVTDPLRLAVSVRVPLGRSSFDRRIDAAVRSLATDTSGAGRDSAAERLFELLPNIPEVFLQQVRRIGLSQEQRAQLETYAAQWKTIAPRVVASISARPGKNASARRVLLEAREGGLVEVQSLVVKIQRLLTSSQRASLEPYEAALLNPRAFRWIELSAYPF